MDILRAKLDPEQLAIAQASNNSLLVVAGPGSGKTRLLTNVAAYQVRRSEPARWRVLCLTFSVEATAQMRSRLTDPSLGIRSPRRLHVANFHQFSAQLLGAYGHLVGWPRDAQLLDPIDAEEMVGELISEQRIAGLSAREGARAIERIRRERPVQGVTLPAESLRRLVEAYEARKLELRVRDFDDLVRHTISLLDDVAEVADIVHRTYRYIVVDELQDTSGYQLELVARLSDNAEIPVFAVADDDQMIYAWRDARAENLAEWEARFRAGRVSLLGNYRCPQKIVDAANALIEHNDLRLGAGEKPYSRVTDREGELVVVEACDERDQANWIADFVAGVIRGGIDPERTAILAANRFTFDDIGTALTARDVPFVRVGEDPATQRPFARALRAALVLAANPRNERARQRLIRLLAGTAEAEDIDALIRAQTLEAMVWVLRRLLELDEDDDDLEHVRRILRLAVRDLGAGSPSALGPRIALEWHRLSVRLQREERSTKVMTTFAAKGLEFAVVILPSFSLGQAPWQPKGVRADRAWWAEERRKVYVAITRAQQEVVFVYAGTPSVFLEEIPDALLDLVATR